MVLKELCDAIRNDIVGMKFPPGMKLTEQVLGKRWKVSRTPIREALRHLESEGFITSIPNKGFVVTPISLQDLEQTYTIMIELDSLAGRLATPLVVQDHEKLERLRNLCKEMRLLCKNKDFEGYSKANREFHSLILRTSENRWLIRILENIHAHTNRSLLEVLFIRRRIDKSTLEHVKIIKHMEKGDAKGVEKAIAAHFANGLKALRSELGVFG